MKRMMMVALAGALVGAGPALAQNGPQDVSEAEVREVLATSKIENVVGSFGEQAVALAMQTAPALDSAARARIEAAVAEAFAPAALHADVVAAVRASADPVQLAELRGWLLAESTRRLEARADSAADAETLEQYAQRLGAAGPPKERVDLAVRHVLAQSAADFYVLIGEQLRAAGHRLAEAADAEGLGAFEPLSDADAAQQRQQWGTIALVSFLQRFEPLTAQEITTLVEGYESPSGQWYVEAYTTALLGAIEAATERAVATLKG